MLDDNSITRFSDEVICSNTPRVNAFLRERLKQKSTLQQIAEEHNPISFLTDDLEIRDTSENETCKWAIVDLKRTFAGRHLYYLAAYDKESCMYDGYLVGDLEHISCGIERHVTVKGKLFYERYNALEGELSKKSETPVVKPISIEPVLHSRKFVDNITHEIYENLLINNWCSESGLARFIRIAGTRLVDIRKKGDTKYFVENAARYAVINTGLIDVYKEDVYVMYQWNETAGRYVPYKQVKGRSDWLNNGFTVEQSQTKLKPLKFFESSDTLGNIDSSAIDIPTGAYKHICDENKVRMASVIGEDFSKEMLADRIRSAVSTCIKMLERDTGYAKPYYTSTEKLSWMLPLHINSGLSEAPEFGLILAKKGKDWYEVKTAVPYDDDVKDRLTASSLYGKAW